VGRDPKIVADLWKQVDATGEFDLSATPYFARIAELGFVSGRSSHADRLTTIRRVHSNYGVIIDTHTADGLKAGLEQREPGVPLVCLETALPAKFAGTIVEALGHEPPRPAGFDRIETLPLRYDVMPADAEAVKRYIEARC